jgi:hypothetical protein
MSYFDINFSTANWCVSVNCDSQLFLSKEKLFLHEIRQRWTTSSPPPPLHALIRTRNFACKRDKKKCKQCRLHSPANDDDVSHTLQTAID